jgi:hypothetical protein
MKMINDIKEFLRGEHFRVGLAIIKMGAWAIACSSGVAMLVGTPDKVPAVAVLILAAMAWPELKRCLQVVTGEEDEKQS